MTPAAHGRQAALDELREAARREIQRRPETRSLLFAVAQYGDGRAAHRMHSLVIASRRDVPVWPHFCEEGGDREGLGTPGERCSLRCGRGLGSVHAPADVFARFCHELGSPDRSDGENFTPYAIARRRGDGGEVDVEVVGKLWRPEEDMLPDAPEAPPRWLELPRARALFAQVCASPADDGPRRVLGDYLLEHGHPRGELIALSLADRLAPAEIAAAAAQRDALLRSQGRQWLSPLGAVIPESGARWDRGFLAHADVYVRSDPPDEVRGAPAWGTVETIRFLRRDLIVPAMVALRDVGPVREGLGALARVRRPWAIERLHAVLEDKAAADALWGAAALPRLTHLALEGVELAAALGRPRPRWWSQLERLTLILDCDTSVAVQEAWRRTCAGTAPWVAVTRRSSITCDLGWEVATGPGGRVELALAGWHQDATPFALWEIVDALPRALDVWLARSRHWAPLPEDAGRLAARAGRAIRVAPP